MAESATWTRRGAEISERSADLVLPEHLTSEDPAVQAHGLQTNRRATTPRRTEPSERRRESGVNESEKPHVQDGSGRTESMRGVALPGDRGPRAGQAGSAPAASEQRPSFWRRIALGRKGHDPEPVEAPPSRLPKKLQATSPLSSISNATPQTGAAALDVEKRIVEPMLQALVSVEAKLERSHVDLMGRSDQVEQRLSQLWDIEEQLGALGEIQESLLQVAEQQRRLDSTIQSQIRAVRWLVGAVFISLAVGAFVVAAVLR